MDSFDHKYAFYVDSNTPASSFMQIPVLTLLCISLSYSYLEIYQHATAPPPNQHPRPPTNSRHLPTETACSHRHLLHSYYPTPLTHSYTPIALPANSIHLLQNKTLAQKVQKTCLCYWSALISLSFLHFFISSKEVSELEV